jgi:hypothetical protein
LFSRGRLGEWNSAMLMTPTQPRSSAHALPAAPHQIYLTHCLHDEGVYRQAGFTIRACSTLDPLPLRFALEYPSYEVPAALRAGKFAPGETPRRLALVRIPGGQNALIHSVHMPEEERGRANNFFSHVLVAPSIRPLDALASWASLDWATSCPAEYSTELPQLVELPRGEAVSDEAVTAFLQPSVSASDEELSTLTCPERLVDDAQRRRELVRRALRGCLLTLQASPTASRGRFYLLAEPGLTALLLYAGLRLLPEALTANVTFSTYENAHRDLRTYRHAQLVGTYLADPDKTLDDEFFTTRGYALDTFQHTCSEELHVDTEPALDEWIDLAARGDWTTIDRVHRLLGKTSTSVVSFKDAVAAAKLSMRLASGQADANDLVALKQAPYGQAILEQHPEKLWPVVREGSLRDERVREEFAGMLREHLPELEQQAAATLREQPPLDWQPSWRLLCNVLANEPAKLRETLQRILPEAPYPSGLRLGLLRELRDCQISPIDQRLPWHALFRHCTVEELEQLAESDLPSEWCVWAFIYALLKAETRGEAVSRLHEADDDLLRIFWEQFKVLKEEGQRRGILAQLFPAGEPEGKLFLERFLEHHPTLKPETLEWLLNSFDAFSRAGAEFWGRDNHLGLLLELLREQGEEASPMWDRLCGQLNREVLLPGDPYQTTLLVELAAVNDRPGPTLPPKTSQTIADWIVLRDHFEKASAIPVSARSMVIDACNRLGLNSIDVLTRYFERFIQRQGTNKAVLDDFVGFFHSFYLDKTEHQDYSSRAIGWLQIVSVCTDETQKADYQRYYFEYHVPLEFRWLLAEETHQAGRLLPIVFEELGKTRSGEGGLFLDEANAVKPEPIDELFQMSGLGGAETSSLLATVGKRVPWLLCTLTAGVLAAYLSGFYKVPLEKAAGIVLFVPLVLALAESMALQSVAMTLHGMREKAFQLSTLVRSLGEEVLAGLLLGLVCGAIAAGVATVWQGSVRLGLSLGAALAGGMAGAALVGSALPTLLCLSRCERRIAAGPLARALVDLLALLIYFGLSSRVHF